LGNGDSALATDQRTTRETDAYMAGACKTQTNINYLTTEEIKKCCPELN